MSDTHRIRNRQTKDPHPRQGSISGIQKGNSKELHDSVSTTRQSQVKPCRTGNTNLQDSLQANLSRSQQHFPDEIMGLTTPTNDTDIKPSQTIQRSTDDIGVAIRTRKF